MTDTIESWRQHWSAYAQAFAQPLQKDGLVSRFVTNPNVTGAYAEAWIRSIARSMLGNKFRISTGAVIRPSDNMRGLQKVRQCDLIVWDPSELPGMFECGEFALVPFAAVRAIIEVKRKIAARHVLIQQLQGMYDLVVPRGNRLGVVIAHNTPLFEYRCKPDWLSETRSEPAVTRLLDGKNRPDIEGTLAFIYFLAQVAGHNREIVK